MTIEQKAIAYDMALGNAKRYYNEMGDDICRVLEECFPELKESEDERIRKTLIDYFDDVNKIDENPLQSYGIHTDKVIAWLEKQGEHANFRNKIQIGDKVTRNEDGALVNISQLNRIAKKRKNQGEQKSDDNVKPKFEVGDWIVDNCGYVWKIEGILNQFYILEGVEGCESRPTIEWVNKTFHPWTIEDSKDGDMTAEKSPLSERDEHWRQKAIDFIRHPDMIKATPTLAKGTIDWLKSLKLQNTWKPSEEQLRELENVFSPDTDSWDEDILRKLYEQLKQL